MAEASTTLPIPEAARRNALIAMVIAFVGIGLSVYATWHHLELAAKGTTDAACNISATVNCDAVAASKYSEVFNIPLGVWGIGFFLALALLQLSVFTQTKGWQENGHGYSAMVAGGVIVSAVLFVISVTIVKVVCPTCIGIYLCVLALAVLTWLNREVILTSLSAKTALSGATNGAVVVAIIVAGFSYARPYLTPKAEPKLDLSQVRDPAERDKLRFVPAGIELTVSKTAYSGLGEDYRRGSDDAKVVIQEFADFQCPACRDVSALMKALKNEFGDRILVVFRNFPLDSTCNSGSSPIHPNACNAAIIGRCAGQTGKFWEMHDLIFAKQAELSLDNLKTLASAVGLSNQQVDACLQSQDILAKIKGDIETGTKAGVDATPTIFINGQKYIGSRGLEDLRQAIEDKL